MPTVHASAVLLGARAVLIRGPSGAGKSRLAWSLLGAARNADIPFARLVGDDRVHLDAVNGRLIARPAPALAGLLEIRSVGLLRLPYEPAAMVGWVVDLDGEGAARYPAPERRSVDIEGVTLPRLALPSCADPLTVLLAFVCGETA